jgi:iron-sulfur cluster insertion protein
MSEAATVAADAAAAADARVLGISASAARRVAELREAQGDDRLMLRISVSGGGCSGFQYGFGFDSAVNDDDLTFERDGVTVVVDEVSLDLLNGAEVDFVEELIGASFQIRNPNASSSCGCGSSFAV